MPHLKQTVTIAGGGLAGLSLAVALGRRGIPVVLHEAGSYPRHRVCGEFISGVQRSTLERLGIADLFSDAVPGRTMRWWREGDRILEGELPEAAFCISRHRLDERLRRRALASGATVVERSRRRPTLAPGEVWAAGRVRCRGEWIGLKCHLSGLGMEADLEMHLGGNGYAGLARVEGGRVNVCGLFRLEKGRRRGGSGLLLDYLRAGGNGELAGRLEEARRDEASFLGVAGFELGWQPAVDGLCRVGDAEGMIPPFTGNGMSMAFEGAEMALDPLTDWSRGRVTWSEVVGGIREAGRRRFRRRVAAAMGMHRVLMSERGRDLIGGLSRAGLLPLRPLLSWVR